MAERRASSRLAGAFLLSCLAPLYVIAQGAPPAAPVRMVTDTVHGVTLEDPYRWMEQPVRPDLVERIWGEMAVSWLPDATGFFYTQMREPDPKAAATDIQQGQRVRFHRLGAPPADDPVVLGAGVNPKMPFDPREFPFIQVPAASDWALAGAGGARPEGRLCAAPRADVRDARTPWRCIAEYEDSVEDVAVHGSDVYLMSSKDAPNRRVLHVRLPAVSLAAAETVVPERAERVLTGIAAARDALYVQVMDRGNDRILRVPYGGGAPQEVPLPVAQAAVTLVGSPDHDGLLFSADTWTEPRAWYAFDPATRKVADLGMRSPLPADVSALKVDVESVDVKSFDGTAVPLTILHRTALARDGSHPAVVLGYGAYGAMPFRPSFNPTGIAWVERGGLAAFCHARGGGEKGGAWYLAGKGPNKRNGVRDFIACAEYLSANGYSRPSRTGAFSQSAGGVLVGGAITERPDAFGAAVIGAGILNPVRMLEGVNGANQIPEFGDPRTADGFQVLMAMDPYDHVKPDVRYPALMLTVGLNDNRVSPWHSGKFAARVQAATASGKPVLIRIDEEAGHGIGSMRDQMAEQMGDMFAFLLWQLGDAGFQPGASTGSAAPPASVLGTGRGLDHVLIVVRNLEEATRTYADVLGFSVIQGGSVPDGVRNSAVLLQGGYLELISVDRSKVPPDHEFARLLEKREGGYAFALNVSSAQQTADFLRARKFDVTAPQGSSFTPEGSKEVQTALWQTMNIKEPSFEFQPMFFIQYAKESTRKVPEHPNTAVRVHSVWIAVKNLEAAAKAYEAVGLRSVGNVQVPALAATGRQIEAGRGVIVLLQAKDASGPLASHVSQYGEGVVGVSIEVRDLDAARSRIQASTKRPLEPYSGPFGKSILVTPESTHGMWIEFFGKTGV